MKDLRQKDEQESNYLILPRRDGWIWRLHGAMNGMRTASRDFTEFLAGILTQHMGFQTLQTGAMFVCA